MSFTAIPTGTLAYFQGVEIPDETTVVRMGVQRWPQPDATDANAILKPSVEMVADAGEQWMQVRFRVPGVLSGNAVTGWSDSAGYVWITAEWSTDLVTWSLAKFTATPVAIYDLAATGGEGFEYVIRATDPLSAHARQFARLGIQTGRRYGKSAPATPQEGGLLDTPTGGGSAPPPVPPPTALPTISAFGTLTAADHAPGTPVSRVMHTWRNAVTISGQWYVDGVATGDTNATRSGTDGQTLSWRETASNALGASAAISNWPEWYVSAQAAARIAEARAEMAAMVAGLPGGATNMDFLAVADYPTKTYTRNASLWAASRVARLTGAVVAKTSFGEYENFGGILTGDGQHVLFCNHAHPYAADTWQYATPPEIMRFLKADGTLVEVEMVCQAQHAQPGETIAPQYRKPGYLELTGGYVDLCVGTLARNIRISDGIEPMPILAVRSALELALLTQAGLPYFSLSQGWSAGRGEGGTPISDYPVHHKKMLYILDNHGGAATSPFDLFDYGVWAGDSGTWSAIWHRQLAYLEAINLGYNGVRVHPGLYLMQLQQMLVASDAGAVAMGRLIASTGAAISSVLLPSD